MSAGFADAQANWSDIIAEATDTSGTNIPIRVGNDKLGYNHYAQNII